MEKKDITNIIQKLREKTDKKNFSQAVDMLINLKGYDLKKNEKIDLYVALPNLRSKVVKLAAFVDAQLLPQAKKVFDTVITKDEFPKWINSKKEQKKLAGEHDFFMAQSEIMANMAGVFGKVLGARGKMPNPKAGCVVPGTANLESLASRLRSTVRLQTKNEASIKLSIGDDKMSDENLASNAVAVYNAVVARLPQGKDNIKYVALKFTMGQLFKIGQEAKK